MKSFSAELFLGTLETQQVNIYDPYNRHHQTLSAIQKQKKNKRQSADSHHRITQQQQKLGKLTEQTALL